MKTVLSKQHSWLLKKFHTFCSRLGLDSEVKRDIVRSYGVESSRDLSLQQLTEICGHLEHELDPQLAEMDMWRKRLMASIGGWLKALNRKGDARLIKAIAVRASQKKSFNDIPLEQLRSLYNAFNKKNKDLAMVENMTIEELDRLTYLN